MACGAGVGVNLAAGRGRRFAIHGQMPVVWGVRLDSPVTFVLDDSLGTYSNVSALLHNNNNNNNPVCSSTSLQVYIWC